MEEPKYKAGATVRLKARTSEIGAIIGEPRLLNRRYCYRVNFAGRISNYPEDELQLAVHTCEPGELFRQGSFGDLDSCLLFLTFLRVAGGLSNYVYSFYNSRTEFMVHQFKPLVKFLDSQHGRILLADEVGLGKTIEAGFVFQEMMARKELRAALVVCPAKLMNKWRRELLERFDLDFTVYRGKGFVAKLAELDRYASARFWGIASYETLRHERIRNALENSRLDLDIVVADEAHVMRNRFTQTFDVGRILADRCAKMLLLTATPINNSREDLFSLLHLLDPSLFGHFEYFEQQRRTNAVVVELERTLRGNREDTARRGLELISALRTSDSALMYSGQRSLDKLEELLRHGGIEGMRDHIEAQRLAAKVNLLSGHMSRTRRVDVDEKRPTREAHLVPCAPTEEESALYSAVFDLLMQHYSDFRLPVMNMERILASCIPAFISHYGGLARGDQEWLSWDDSDMDDEDEEDAARVKIPGLVRLLRTHGAAILANEIDTKYDELLRILRELDEHDPSCKVIIFSYFRKTITYLASKLRDGYRNVAVHGGIPTCPEDPERDEREQLRRAFQTDPKVRIMISSEVGSEGLDFQFSHVLINYDLPWNPMRVEQRIGRIDRIGQQSERLLIYSLVIRDTIDETIYEKLLKKIGLFRESIGDLEAIIGDEVRELRDAVFDPRLSSEQKEARIERVAEVLHRKRLDLEELERDSSKIIGVDQYIIDEIGRIHSSKRFVGPDEIRRLVHRAFQWSQINLNVLEDGDGVYKARIRDSARHFFDQYMDQSRAANVFRSRLHDKQFRWTFGYEVAANDPELELLNLRHPAVRAVCKLLEHDQDRLAPTFKVSVAGSELPGSFTKGLWGLALFLVEYRGVYDRKELEPLAWDFANSEVMGAEEADHLLSEVLVGGRDVEVSFELPKKLASKAIDALERHAEKRFRARQGDLASDEQALLDQRRAQVGAQMEREVEAQSRRRETLEERHAQARGKNRQRLGALLKGVETRVANIRDRAASKLSQLGEPVEPVVSWDMKAIGVVLVEG